MKRSFFAPLTAFVLALATSMGAAAAQGAPASHAQLAFRWLQCTEQQPNGQIGPNGDNPIARSSELVVGLAAAGVDASTLSHGGLSLADYLKTAVSVDVGTNGDLLLARALEPSTGLTTPVIATLTAMKSGGEYGSQIFGDALAILGLSAAGQAVGADAIGFLRNSQNTDHGWSFDSHPGSGSDSNTTSLVLQALIASGVAPTDPAVSDGLRYLATQFAGGGFVYSTAFGQVPDPQSDELGIEAIVAAGVQQNADWATRLQSAEADLASRQISSGPDAGALTAYDKLQATTPAPTAFLLRPLTARGLSQSSIALLACPPTAAATPTPTPTPVPRPATSRAPSSVTTLAPTGGGQLPLLGVMLGLLLLAGGVLRLRRA